MFYFRAVANTDANGIDHSITIIVKFMFNLIIKPGDFYVILIGCLVNANVKEKSS
jgi:hypothetical protein